MGFIINNSDKRIITVDWSNASQTGFNSLNIKLGKTVGSSSSVLYENLTTSSFTDVVNLEDVCNILNYKVYFKATNSSCSSSITHTSNDYSQISVIEDSPTEIGSKLHQLKMVYLSHGLNN